MNLFSPSKNTIPLIVVFIAYVFFVLAFGFAYRYQINPDGISELRLAGYLADGDFMRSAVSGWCPLNIWGMAFFLFLGFEELTAARMAIASYGAGMLLCSWFLSSRFELSVKNRFISALIAALLISFWTVQSIAADVLIAALILCYIYVVTDQNILRNNRVAFLCGVVGGLSYMAYHYALPFFLVHFPVILFLKGHFERDNKAFPWKKVFTSWGIGISGFLIIASLWIGIISAKYGELTISFKGGAAHAIMGPKDVDRRHPFFVGGLFKPRDDYAMHVFEDPSEVKFKTWSPFESRAYFIHQIKVIKDNAVYITNHFVSKSPFFTYSFVIGVFALVPIAFMLTQFNNRKKYLYTWVIITLSIYCSGFLLLIARSPRRFYSLMIVFVLISFHFMEELRGALRKLLSERNDKVLAIYLFTVAILAFSLKPGVELIKSIRYVATQEQINPYQEMADQIKTHNFPEPYAIIRSSQKPHTDTFIAYYLKKQLLGRPQSKDIDGITEELNAAGGRSLMVFDNPEIVEELKQDNRYLHIASKKLEGTERYVSVENINIRDHEIVTGWDKEVSIFSLKD